MKMNIRDGGQWKTVNKLHVRDGGQWKEVKRAWVRDGGQWKQFYDSAVAAPDFLIEFGVTAFDFGSGGFATATLQLFRDGSRQDTAANSSGNTITNPSNQWAEGSPLASNFGDDYEIRATLVSGTLTGGTTGSWLRMNTTRSWQVNAPAPSTSQSATLSFEIRPFGGGSVLYSSPNLTISASVSGF